MSRLRRALYCQLDPAALPKPRLSRLNVAIAVVVVVSVIVAVLETEPTLTAGRESLFRAAEWVFVVLFTLEYLARLWTAAEADPARPGRMRLRYVFSLLALIDLATLLALFVTSGPASLLRMARVLRIARLAKLGRLSRAAALIVDSVAARRSELLLTLIAAMVALLVAATLLHLVEGEVQPDKFGSIPRSMWWAVVTLTTIGYGDVYPVTVLGKILAGATAVVGIGLIAAPTGILAAAFSEALQQRREAAAEAADDDG